MEIANILIWKKELSIGYSDIDEDHKKLCKMINQLFGAVMSPNAESILAGVLDGLIEYTVFHFKREEELMIKYDYPGYKHHRWEHEKLILTTKDFKSRFELGGGLQLGKDVELILREWLVNHILNVDKQLGVFLCGLSLK